MHAITRFEHPASIDAPEMFVLRAERDLWAEVLLAKVGDLDMFESAELAFSYGMYPEYHRHIHLVASDGGTPTCQEHVLGVASLDMPMADNPRLAILSLVVRSGSRGKGVGGALHAAALKVAEEFGRSTIQVWTWEPVSIPDGARELPAETGVGGVERDSAESRFLAGRGYTLGQAERISRMALPSVDDLAAMRDAELARMPSEYEIITIHGPTPDDLLDGAAALSATMAADVPTGDLDVGEELWDAERLRASDAQLDAADRDQLQTLIRHVPSGELVGFTRFLHDRSRPEIAHQWETLVVGGHRGHGLGMLMKAVNHAAIPEVWPRVTRLITGNASENAHMLAINTALGYEPYAACGFWEWRRGADG
ncbi:GNAT family N-acetyltransferase [Tessaracoccus antarcticus]|uniref:GNAT family N-acetyltransferase n=1 Tax=Tessaracoccus antarcticus TaxID=2479848 RepID=A0A3M0G7S9_9ACTN|nr:GNAT family N-acetyltransferase [Tessaracoccus antarcticus]RMB57743.1 GNAT family N-acetyltransferase [Tessaracoccus antarcticus]